jgi:hypothetical protein
MALNVAAPPARIKHVFEWRVVPLGSSAKPFRSRMNHKCVTLPDIGYLRLVTVVETDELVGGVI